MAEATTTIWGSPFEFSDLIFPLTPVAPAIPLLEDEWGIPIPPLNSTQFMLVKAKLKVTKKLTKEEQISLALEKMTLLFEGNIISKTPGGVLLPGTKGTGIINGKKGDIKLISTGQSSLEIIRRLLGEKITIAFNQTVSPI